MPDVESIIREPVYGLLSPYVFWVLVAVTGWAMWSRRVWLSAVAAALIVAVVMHREQMLGIFVRIMVEKTGPGKTFSEAEFEGARLMYSYCRRTELYSVGSAGLLSALAVVGKWRAGRKGSMSLAPTKGSKAGRG